MYILSQIGNFLIVISLLKIGKCDEHCHVPLGIKTPALPPDDRYSIEILDIVEDAYVPKTRYDVILKSKNETSKFIAFTISATGDTSENPDNPRRPKNHLPGKLFPVPEFGLTTFGECNNTIIQTNVVPKTEVKVIWEAPPEGNGCVTIHAAVAIRQDMYYSGLTRRVCQDTRKREDMPPEENSHCTVREEARYKMIFEGLWSYNTHRQLYPMSKASFSDIVGASHKKGYAIFNSNHEASEGVRSLAEQGNTTILEMDLQEAIGENVRTIIKATKPSATNATTTAMFRVTKDHHLVSIVTAILPSPDWFLGASNLELCDKHKQEWAKSITYNLYPLDAGTDKGADFNSANDMLIPAQPISSTIFQNPPKEQKPFAKVHFNLIRRYKLPEGNSVSNEAEQENNETDSENNGEGGEDVSSESGSTVTTTSELPLVTDPESSTECPMTTWSEWSECDGSCDGGKRSGYHSRQRYYKIDNQKVMYGDEELYARVPDHCKVIMDINDFGECSEDCEVTTTAEPVTEQRVAPGYSWRTWFN